MPHATEDGRRLVQHMVLSAPAYRALSRTPFRRIPLGGRTREEASILPRSGLVSFHQAWLTNITRSREPLTSFAPPSYGRTAPTADGGRMRRTSGNTAKGEAASRSTRRRPFLIEDCDTLLCHGYQTDLRIRSPGRMGSGDRARRGDAAILDFSSHLRHKRPHECGRGTQECVRHALIRQPAFEAVAQTLMFAASALIADAQPMRNGGYGRKARRDRRDNCPTSDLSRVELSDWITVYARNLVISSAVQSRLASRNGWPRRQGRPFGLAESCQSPCPRVSVSSCR